MSHEIAKAPSAATASTQQPTQSTEDGSQTSDVTDEDLWGSLVPCSPILPRYKLHKSKLGYRIGRDPENDIVISSRFISSFQCTIEWDGDTGPKSSVIVTDHSRHGTFVNGDRIEKAVILRDGHVIGLGTHKPRPKEGGIHDYRYIYRHLAYKPPKGGVHNVYDMQHELGKGSYATVVKALHKQEGKWYAIKIISTHKLRGHWTDDAALEGLPQTKDARRLLREITVLERLQHKNICQLREVFVHSRNVYLVLELVPGGDLLRYLMQLDDRGRRMTEQEAKRITYQICDALAYVHRQGIAHRDLKPENVLLTNDKPPVVKVADFGLAKVIDTLTKLHTVCGTPIYLAPEVVLRGWSDGYDQIVDSWSVGIITMIMLTMDTQPVSSVDPHADLKAQIEKRRVNWELLRLNRVSAEGEDFIRNLLQDDPSKRMTLEDARHHPWLANADKPSASDTGKPASGPPSRNLSRTRDDVPALDTRLASIHVHPPARRRGGSTSSESGDDGLSGSFVRRADVLARARETGRPLPSPSQEMRERAAAEDEHADADVDAGPAEGPRARTPSPAEDDAGERAKAQKRKIADRSDSSLFSSREEPKPTAPSTSAAAPAIKGAAEPSDDNAAAARKSSGSRRPAPKRARNRGSAMLGDNMEEEVPGLTLGVRRSSRLNPGP